MISRRFKFICLTKQIKPFELLKFKSFLKGIRNPFWLGPSNIGRELISSTLQSIAGFQ